MRKIENTKWDKRFMEVARLVATWSSCYQENRQIGAVIVLNKRIITTGYNGAPSGIENCKEKEACLRKDMKIESGTRHELCFAIHAEQNAIIQAARLGIPIVGATLYCTHQPCMICAKMIINSGINRIVYSGGYPDGFSLPWFKEANVELVQYEE
ncbi:MAG: dCMP deaminase family protein [Firmicutes bacterium]|nr:dCMP deaminase family protein [Bacillota bacterium]